MSDLRTRLVAAIEHHGEESGPEYMLGDLEQVLDVVLAIMTPAQQRKLAADPMIEGLLEDWTPSA